MEKKYVAEIEGIYRAYDTSVVKKEVSDLTRDPLPLNGVQNRAASETYDVSISDMLKSVNDNDGVPYISASEMSEETKKAVPDRVFNSFDAAEAYIREQVKEYGNTVRNESDKIAAQLAQSGIKKMLSMAATDKSLANGFTLRDHITAAANIIKLYKNSELLFAHEDKKRRSDITEIKRFGAPVVLPDSKDAAVAYITVREIRGAGNKMYSVELMSFELLKAEKMPPGNFRTATSQEWKMRPTGDRLNITDSEKIVNTEELLKAEKMPQ